MTRIHLAAAAALAALVVAAPASAEPTKPIRAEIGVNASIDDVWAAWTTSAGAQSFFGPKAHVELAPGGAYDIRFKYGYYGPEPGPEGLHVLSFVPGEMISFEWSAPMTMPKLRKRGATSFVVVQLTSMAPKKTKVVLHHLGWAGEGPEFDQYRAYFNKAWPMVLSRLQRRFEQGKPIDFAKP